MQLYIFLHWFCILLYYYFLSNNVSFCFFHTWLLWKNFQDCAEQQWWKRCPCQVPDLRGKVSVFHYWTCCLLGIHAKYSKSNKQVHHADIVSVCALSVFIMKVLNLNKCFVGINWDDYVIFPFTLVNVEYYIDHLKWTILIFWK